MEITAETRRNLIALACRLAWADGVVTDEEREFVVGMVKRFAAKSVTIEELDTWLTEGPPEASLESLPKGVDDLFVYEAMRLMEADGDIAESETRALDEIMRRLFNNHPKGTPLAKIALKKRAYGV